MIGAFISAASNALTQWRSGQRVKVDVDFVRLTTPGGWPPEPALAVAVSAFGGTPVQVTGWNIVYPGGERLDWFITALEHPNALSTRLNPQFPVTIRPGEGMVVYVSILPSLAADPQPGHSLSEGHLRIQFAARGNWEDRRSIASRMARGIRAN